MITAEDIKKYGLFSSLEENELSEIAGLCTRRIYGHDSIIFEPNAPSEEIFIVESGNDAIQIEISMGTGDSKMVIHTLSKGETFGWAALAPQHIKTAVARCVETAGVITINGKKLVSLCERNNHIGYILMRNLIDIINTRLSYTTVVMRHEINKCRKVAMV